MRSSINAPWARSIDLPKFIRVKLRQPYFRYHRHWKSEFPKKGLPWFEIPITPICQAGTVPVKQGHTVSLSTRHFNTIPSAVDSYQSYCPLDS